MTQGQNQVSSNNTVQWVFVVHKKWKNFRLTSKTNLQYQNAKQYYNTGQGVQLEDWTSYVGNNSENDVPSLKAHFAPLK